MFREGRVGKSGVANFRDAGQTELESYMLGRDLVAIQYSVLGTEGALRHALPGYCGSYASQEGS